MTTFSKILILVWVTILPFVVSCAQNNRAIKQEMQPKGNMRIENNRILVQTIIDSKDSVVFLFDTGCPMISVLRDSIAKHYTDIRNLSVVFANGEALKYQNVDSTKIKMDFIVDPTGSDNLILGTADGGNYRFWSINYDDMMLQILPNSTIVDTTDAIVLDFEILLSGKNEIGGNPLRECSV